MERTAHGVSSGLRGKVHGVGRALCVWPSFADGLADDAELGRELVTHPTDLVAAAKVERRHGRQLLDERQREPRDALPHRRVGAGADVRVHARGREVVLLDERLRDHTRSHEITRGVHLGVRLAPLIHRHRLREREA